MPQTIIDLGQKVKAKYPGTYDNLDDAEVGRRVQAKYPQYSQFMDVPQGSTAPKVDMKELPPTALQQFGTAVADQVKGLPAGLYNTIRHPLDSSPFGQDMRYQNDPQYANAVDQQMNAAFNQSPAQLAGGVTGQAVNGAIMAALTGAAGRTFRSRAGEPSPSGSINLPAVPGAAEFGAEFLPGGKKALAVYNRLRNGLAGPKTKVVPAPDVTYPKRQAPVAAPAITFPEQLSPVAAPAVSYPQKPGVVAAPQVTFPETQAPVSAPPVTYSRQAATKVVPAPPVTYPAPPAPTKVVPPPPLSWLTRTEEAPTVPAGTDKVVVKNGQPFTNQNGKLAPATKPAGLPRGADGKFISPLEKQLQDSITNALARKTKK